jgi:hypothetical protein
MALKVKQLPSFDYFELFAQGGISGGPVVQGFDLIGKTITFDLPAFTHTFTGTAGTRLTFQEVKTQLETASAGALTVRGIGGRIVFVQTTPTTRVKLSTAQDARVEFGLARNGTIEGLVLSAPGGAAPSLINAYPDNGRVWVIYVE